MQQVGTVNKNEQKGTENRTLRKTEGDGLRISVENERAWGKGTTWYGMIRVIVSSRDSK